MHKINYGRLILAGIIAAVILDILDYLADGVLLGSAWAASLKADNLAPISANGMIAFNVAGVVTAFLAIFLYAAIRPRFGPGPKTALIAAAVVWALGWPLSMVAPLAMHVVPHRLAIHSSLLGILEMAIAVLAGAYFYKEEPAA